jgi:hypothetical protein
MPPLDVPAKDNLDADDVLRHGAVKLFVARAHTVEPRYLPDRRLASATSPSVVTSTGSRVPSSSPPLAIQVRPASHRE